MPINRKKPYPKYTPFGIWLTTELDLRRIEDEDIANEVGISVKTLHKICRKPISPRTQEAYRIRFEIAFWRIEERKKNE